MKAISIQVQPHRAPGLDVDALRAVFERIATSNPLVERHQFDDGEDKVRYFNFTFGTRDLRALWEVLREQAYADRALGPLLTVSSIATCEGPHGWDDYLLLHHFDPAQPCEAI